MKRRQEPQQAAERIKQLRSGAETQAARATAAVACLAHELQVHQIELEMQNEELRRTQMELEAARDRYLDLYDFALVGYFTLGADGCIAEANLTLASLLGVERARLVGRRFDRHIVAMDRDRWNRHVAALLGQSDAGRIELGILGGDRRRLEAQLDGMRLESPGAQPMLRFALTDISERRRSEAELRVAAAAFETQEGIMITDQRGVIERVNRAFTEITGYSAAEAIGQTGRLLHSGHQDAAFYAAMWEGLLRTGAWQGEIWNRRKNGELYAEWLSITAVSGRPERDHALRRHDDGHLAAQGARGGSGPARLLRRAHRPAEPAADEGPAVPGAGGQRAHAARRCADVHRPRSLQGHQRHPRPRQGRRVAASGRAAADLLRARGRHGGAAGRRRVRRHAGVRPERGPGRGGGAVRADRAEDPGGV